jgi:hypothetical protein
MILRVGAQQARIAARSMMHAAPDDCGAEGHPLVEIRAPVGGISVFGFGSWLGASVVRRTTAVLALALAASAWMIIAGVAPASACSDTNGSNHCYAAAFNNNTATNHGVYGQLYVHCLYQPSNGNRANNEIWDEDSGYNNWVEAGITSGIDYHGTYRNKDWFWADKRPGYDYFEHDFSQSANTDTKYRTKIEFHSADTWYVYGYGNYSHYGTSTSNSATLIHGVGGTEYLGGSTSGIRDQGSVYSLERKSSSDTWYSWGNNAGNQNLGPGAYIDGHYDPSTSHEYWSGPC